MAIEMEMEMDLGTPVVRTRTPDSDTDTPPHRSTPTNKRLHYTNDRHAPGVSYKECMKNHAASIGGHALDGCCEFMPGPTFNHMDPTSLKCGACGCHRNFHRRDPDDPAPLNHHHLTPARRAHSPPTASQLLLSLSQSPSGPSDEVNPMSVSLGGGACGGGGGVLVGYNGNFSGGGSGGSSRKRFRTKFSQEQKEKMYEFSEKIGWKLKKGEERLVEDFVKEIGVGRSVFKVWMHNNKHTSSSSTAKTRGETNNNNNNHNEKKLMIEDNLDVGTTATTTTTTTTTTTGVSFLQQQQQQQQHSTSNGSKSSSHVGNCGASVVVDHNLNNNLNHHHHHHHHNRQFNFANGGGQQEAAQAQ